MNDASTGTDIPVPETPTPNPEAEAPSPLDRLIEDVSAEFDAECQRRHTFGALKYGPVKFLEPGNDLFQMLAEELVDAANYCRYFYIRLVIMQEMMKGTLPPMTDTPKGPGAIVNPFRK